MKNRAEKTLDGLVRSPSIGAIKYQAKVLIAELQQVSDQDYPTQACRMRDVFLCVAAHVLEELETLAKSVTNEPGLDYERIRALASIIRKLYSFLQHLRASSADQSPPPIQYALSQLTDLYFPKGNGEPLALVRSQYDYNLTFENMGWNLLDIAAPFVLDPFGKLGATDPEGVLAALWKKWIARKSELTSPQNHDLPTQLAILSFAGLDTHDTLVYPLLAHELGHFIDHSSSPSLHINVFRSHGGVSEAAVSEVLHALGQDTGDRSRRQALRYATAQATACLRELIADLLGSRMLGFGFFCAQAEYLKTISTWPQSRILFHPDRPWVPWGYPGVRYRLEVTLKHIVGDEKHHDSILHFFDANSQVREESKILADYVREWLSRVSDAQGEPSNQRDELSGRLTHLAEETVAKILPALNEAARQIIPADQRATLGTRFFERIDCLRQELPPWIAGDDKRAIAEILSAAWAYQIVHGEKREESLAHQGLERQLREYHKTCRLVLKAIELCTATEAVTTAAKLTSGACDLDSPSHQEVGVLSATSIRRRLQLPVGDESRLHVVPIDFAAVQAASLDVHLGNWFASFRRTMLKAVDLTNPLERARLVATGKQLTFVPHGNTFLIHPGDFILGTTLEFVGLPSDVMAFVEGRSSLGRLGLLVATATQIAPGFHGVIVLELVNTGTVPLSVSPGISIAQLVLQTLTVGLSEKDRYQGEHQCQIHP